MTHVPVFLSESKTSEKHEKITFKILQLPHMFPCLCVHAYTAWLKLHSWHRFEQSFPFPLENHWQETEIGQANTLPYIWLLHRRAWTLPQPSVGNGLQHLCSGNTEHWDLCLRLSLKVNALNWTKEGSLFEATSKEFSLISPGGHRAVQMLFLAGEMPKGFPEDFFQIEYLQDVPVVQVKVVTMPVREAWMWVIAMQCCYQIFLNTPTGCVSSPRSLGGGFRVFSMLCTEVAVHLAKCKMRCALGRGRPSIGIGKM